MKFIVEFTNSDLDSLHDVVYEAIDKSLSYEELEKIFNELPEHIQSLAVSWGMSDTVFRDNVYEHLKKKK